MAWKLWWSQRSTVQVDTTSSPRELTMMVWMTGGAGQDGVEVKRAVGVGQGRVVEDSGCGVPGQDGQGLEAGRQLDDGFWFAFAWRCGFKKNI